MHHSVDHGNHLCPGLSSKIILLTPPLSRWEDTLCAHIPLLQAVNSSRVSHYQVGFSCLGREHWWYLLYLQIYASRAHWKRTDGTPTGTSFPESPRYHHPSHPTHTYPPILAHLAWNPVVQLLALVWSNSFLVLPTLLLFSLSSTHPFCPLEEVEYSPSPVSHRMACSTTISHHPRVIKQSVTQKEGSWQLNPQHYK